MENKFFEEIVKELQPLISELNNHKIYSSINSIDSLRIFMEYHAYASWDSMSLLKALQKVLTINKTIWIPPNNIASRYVNELILEEESDMINGQPISHFELYLKAMEDVGADTTKINKAVQIARSNNSSINEVYAPLGVPDFVKSFLDTTFEIIESDSQAEIASSIYFARENLIPVIFPELLKNIKASNLSFENFTFYLERHIELDSGSHSILAKNTLLTICDNSKSLWSEAHISAQKSLKARIKLWDGIYSKILASG